LIIPIVLFVISILKAFSGFLFFASAGFGLLGIVFLLVVRNSLDSIFNIGGMDVVSASVGFFISLILYVLVIGVSGCGIVLSKKIGGSGQGAA
jgi:hypothetical protein